MSEDTTEVQAELERLRKALKDANAEAKSNREAKEALETRVQELESDETVTKMQRRIVSTEAKNRLLAEGVKDPDRVLKYLKSENVKVTDDGLEGLDDVLKEVKADFPELFDAKRRAGGKADIFANETAPTKKTSSEIQAEMLGAL